MDDLTGRPDDRDRAEEATRPALPGPPIEPTGRLARVGVPIAVVSLMVVTALLAIAFVGTRDTSPPMETGARPDRADLVIEGSAPLTWDPARAGDAGSAALLAQVWEGLTTWDQDGRLQPALARDWEVSDDGLHLSFRLRPGITFSDGTPIRARDVVASWMRVIDPAAPGPLAALLNDVEGVSAYLAGEADAGAVGIRAQGDDVVTLDFVRPASWFPAAAASPTFAVVPSDLGSRATGPGLPEGLVVSGGYVPVSHDAGGIRLEANERYWAGRPAIGSIVHRTDSLDGPVDSFQAGTVDLVPISALDARWVAYDPVLGPQLRRTQGLDVQYLGFDTTRPPFDDVRVRQAFGWAVDWRRLVELSDPESIPATSVVPEGIDLRGEGDFSPRHDPDAARAALAAAGYPGGEGFPDVTLVTSGTQYDAAIAAELRRELGVELGSEVMPFPEFTRRLDEEPPAMWQLGWAADFPHPQDFLGLLLETGSANNVGGWSDAAFDAALDAAASTDDPAEQMAHYQEAQRIVADQVPLIALEYPEDWALSRDGLLGAGDPGLGIIRYAGLGWAP
ncbi:MAG: peptide ABC transporter substrate-binding protein [Candidatus Limnocylindrales bacterium]